METRSTPRRVFYINLDASKDRRVHMESSLSDFAGTVERVPAVALGDVGRMPYAGYVERQGVDDNLQRLRSKSGRKTAACWLSHVMLWERLQKELAPLETALILEDDVQFPDGWTQRLPDAVRGAPKGWDLLKVCGWGRHRAADSVDGNWSVPRWPIWENGFLYTGSCGYIVSGASLANVLKRTLSQAVKDIDVAMMLPAPGDAGVTYAVYELKPGHRLLETGGFSSTIRGAFCEGSATYLGYAEDEAADFGPLARIFFQIIRANTLLQDNLYSEAVAAVLVLSTAAVFFLYLFRLRDRKSVV